MNFTTEERTRLRDQIARYTSLDEKPALGRDCVLLLIEDLKARRKTIAMQKSPGQLLLWRGSLLL